MDNRITSKTVLFIAILALVVAGGWIFYSSVYAQPLKTTDPKSPNFDPLHFEGRDYKDNPELRVEAIRKAMPQGTSFETIQTINANDDKCFVANRSPNYQGLVFFTCASSVKYPTGQNRIFLFDNSDKLIDYFGSGSPGIYTGKTVKQIKQETKK